jgi:acetaldehyde dehydrogenase
MIMRNTVFCSIPAEAAEPGDLRDAIIEAVHAMVQRVQEYVPGYELKADPQFDLPSDAWSGMARVAILLQVRGRGDYLPDYAGNLDIITAAAARIGELLAKHKFITAGAPAGDAR